MMNLQSRILFSLSFLLCFFVSAQTFIHPSVQVSANTGVQLNAARTLPVFSTSFAFTPSQKNAVHFFEFEASQDMRSSLSPKAENHHWQHYKAGYSQVFADFDPSFLTAGIFYSDTTTYTRAKGSGIFSAQNLQSPDLQLSAFYMPALDYVVKTTLSIGPLGRLNKKYAFNWNAKQSVSLKLFKDYYVQFSYKYTQFGSELMTGLVVLFENSDGQRHD